MKRLAFMGLFVLASSCGDVGPAGPEGPPGDHGDDGAPGMDGMDGMDGVDAQGGAPVDGAPGMDGDDGSPGAPGLQGPPGSANIAGTAGNLVRFSGADTGDDSLVIDDGAGVGIGLIDPLALLTLDVPVTNTTQSHALVVNQAFTGFGHAAAAYVTVTGEGGTGSKYGVLTEMTVSPGEAVGYQATVDAPIANGATLVVTATGSATGVRAIAASTGPSASDSAYAFFGTASALAGSSYGVYLSGEDYNYFSGRVGIGTATPSRALHVRGAGVYVATFDKLGGGSGIVNFSRDGSLVGNITESGGTTSYNAFTGSHYADLDSPIDPGMVVTLTGQSRRFSEASAEPVYRVIPSSGANRRSVLGTYSNAMPEEGGYHLINAVGNTDVWVVDQGQNISAGDALITAKRAGHAMKDNGEFDVAYAFARAAEAVDWARVEPAADGVKRKKVSVLLDSFVVNHRAERLEARLSAIEERLARLEAAPKRGR